MQFPKMRPRIYLSGPISNGGTAKSWERIHNVEFAAQVMLDLIGKGFAVLCPQLTEFAERLTRRHMPHELWLANDFPWVDVSDAVLRLPGESKGSDMEVLYAMSRGIPVFDNTRYIITHFGMEQSPNYE